MAQPVAALIVRVAADLADLKSSVGDINNTLGGMSSALGTVGKMVAGAFTVSAVTAFAKEIISFASDMKDLSLQTGIGVERLQALNLVGMDAGVSVNQIAEAVSQLSKRLVGGNDAAVTAVERLGLNVENLIAMDPDLAFIRIAEAVAQIPNPMERNAIMMELFGRSGAKFLPMVTEELGKLVDAAQRSSGIISDAVINRMDEVGDKMVRARQEAMGFGVGLLELTSGPVTLFNRSLQAFTAQFANANDLIADTIAKHAKHADTVKVVNSVYKDLGMTKKEFLAIEEKLTGSALKSIEEGLQRQAVEAARAAEAHRNLQAIIGIGHMKAAQEFVAAMQIFKSETMQFNALIDDVGENFKNTWSKDVVLTVHDGSQAMNETLDTLAREGKLSTQDMTMSMGEYFRSMFADVGSGVDNLMGMLADALGGRMGNILNTFQGLWNNARSIHSGILRGMSGDFSGWMDAIMGGISLVRSAWNALKGLFGGGEEGTVVNPARDTFLSQWGDPSNKGVGGAGHNLAALLTSLGAGEGGGGIFSALQGASTMAVFRPAAQAIVEFLSSKGHSGSMNFHSGGMVPGTGEVRATLLGGERVQSRGEVGDMRGMLGEMRGLREDFARYVENSHRSMRDEMQIALGSMA